MRNNLRKLYPRFTDEELIEAERNLDNYIKVVLRVMEEIERDPERQAKFERLTGRKWLPINDPQEKRSDSNPPHPNS